MASGENYGQSVTMSKEDLSDFKARNGLDKPASSSQAVNEAQPSAKSSLPGDAAKEVGKTMARDYAESNFFTDGRESTGRVGAIVIGETTALSEITDAEKTWDAIVAKSQSQGIPVKFSKEWYLANAAGSAVIKPNPSIWKSGVGVVTAVSKVMKDRTAFAAGKSAFAATGDLVVAEAFERKGTWITKVLCRKNSADFESCSGKYARGMFQSIDGKEIGPDHRLIKDGQQIDPVTFEKIASAK
jgi:hypothetical protein